MKMATHIRLVAFLVCCAICPLSLIGCNRSETPAVPPASYQSEDLYFCNGIDGFDKEGVILPDFEVESTYSRHDRAYIFYKNVTPASMEAYCTRMEQNGFVVVKNTNHTYFYSDSCWVAVCYTENISTGEVELWWRAKSANAPADGVTAEQAKQIIGTDCPYPLIDVTPVTLYEATGGQIFCVPNYGSGSDAVFSEEDAVSVAWEDRPRSMYFVTESYALPMDMASIAYVDMDGNGTQEVWLICNGATSGIFTYGLICYENGEIKYKTMNSDSFGDLYFVQKNGKLCLEHQITEYKKGEAVGYEVKQYEISIKDGEIQLGALAP